MKAAAVQVGFVPSAEAKSRLQNRKRLLFAPCLFLPHAAHKLALPVSTESSCASTVLIGSRIFAVSENADERYG